MQTNHQDQRLSWEEIVKFLKDYGFIIESAKMYGGLKSAYDYGPLGNKIKDTIKQLWKREFVDQEQNVHLIESTILTKPKVLEASGHFDAFDDWLLTCTHCQRLECFNKQKPSVKESEVHQFIDKWETICRGCQKTTRWKWTKRSLIFQTKQGTIENLTKKQKFVNQLIDELRSKTEDIAKGKVLLAKIETELNAIEESISGIRDEDVFLRPETAQGSFVNFSKIVKTLKLSLPFGLVQIGKVFRNEITTEHANFRTCEFEQMEVEFFFLEESEKNKWFKYWETKTLTFLEKTLQIKSTSLRTREHTNTELAHYAIKTLDFEYKFPFGWHEIWGLSDRGQYDLRSHQSASKEDLTVINSQQAKVLPFVVEPSAGVERLMLSLIVDNLEKIDNKLTLKLPKQFCYYQVAVLPLTEKLTIPARKIYQTIAKNHFRVRFDDKRSVGKRYLFHDAIGTYLCVTVDFQSLEDQQVTVRFRDTKQQTRVPITELITYLKDCFQEDG